jgi:hypothetical protein
VVLSVSGEFPLRAAPNSAGMDMTEVARTEVAFDDASPTFSLVFKVLCSKGVDKLLRFQVVWTTSTNMVVGENILGESAALLAPWFTLHTTPTLSIHT